MPFDTTPRVLLFLKAPRPGFVKTRLAKTIGDHQACGVYRSLVAHTLAQIPPSWQLVIHYAPAEAEEEMKNWLGERATFVPQPEGDLGARLQHACRQSFEKNPKQPVILLGGDCPGLTTAHLKKAHAALSAGDSVIGPARDGGYWLLGLPECLPSVFENKSWSTAKLYAETLATFKNLALSVTTLETLEDIDEEETWQRLRFHLDSQNSP